MNFPVLPLLVSSGETRINLRESSAKLSTPRDFDYSPYFEIVKYPMFAVDELAIYRKLPWLDDDIPRDEGGAEDNSIEAEQDPEPLTKNAGG